MATVTEVATVTNLQPSADPGPLDVFAARGVEPESELSLEHGKHQRVAHCLRGGLSLGTVGAPLVASKRGTLTKSLSPLGHSHWSWIPVAIGLELTSMAASAPMQGRLLRADGKRLGRRPMMATILAANALRSRFPWLVPSWGPPSRSDDSRRRRTDFVGELVSVGRRPVVVDRGDRSAGGRRGSLASRMSDLNKGRGPTRVHGLTRPLIRGAQRGEWSGGLCQHRRATARSRSQYFVAPYSGPGVRAGM